MATVAFPYDHARDPMHPLQLADQIASALNLVVTPTVDINPTQIIVEHPNVTEANRAAIQNLINAYVLDPDYAGAGTGVRGSLLVKARKALTVNNTYLAKASPTAAETTAQARALTRECSGIIKLLIEDFGDTSGT